MYAILDEPIASGVPIGTFAQQKDQLILDE
jgi:hypothetical protein